MYCFAHQKYSSYRSGPCRTTLRTCPILVLLLVSSSAYAAPITYGSREVWAAEIGQFRTFTAGPDSESYDGNSQVVTANYGGLSFIEDWGYMFPTETGVGFSYPF